MDIERLKELKDYLRVANELSILNDDNLMQRIVDNNDVTNTIDIAIELLNAEIARQSVKSEDVQKAIKTVEGIAICSSFKDQREDAKLAITALQAYQPWISVEDRLPEKPEYDWVLVHITLSPDGFVGLPHVAELRRGKWFSTEYSLPIEQILQGTVTHWKPLPEPPKGE